MSPITTIIFDLGGVIVKVDKTRMSRALANHTELSVDKITKVFSSKTATLFDTDIMTGKITPEEFFNKCVKEFHLKDLSFEKFKQIYSDIFTLIPETAEIIRTYSKTHKLILLSNTDVIHYSYCEKKFKSLFDLFAAKTLSFNVGAVKPEKKIYLEAVKMAGEKPENCIYIDDVKEYADAAEKVGMKGIHFISAQQLKKELEKLTKQNDKRLL
jgi:putative hydrolase of the HAD superfamily